MFCLHVSNRTENLLHHLAEVIRVDRQPDIFAAELFLIQSQGMERMIGQTMADQFGSFCNYRFYLPLDFLANIAARLGIGVSSDGFLRQTLAWRLESLLRDIPGEIYRPIRSYLSGEGGELKRFQLARKLANIFDQYQVMRTDMLAQWEKGCLVTGHQAEEWQRDLWRRLLRQEGGAVHRGILFRQVIEKLASDEDLAGSLPKRIAVFGLHTMPPVFLQYLSALACHMDVHLFLLSPCRHYWGNIESKKSRIKRMIGEGEGAAAGEEVHPLLVSLGRQGRDLQNLMLEEADFALELTSYDETMSEEAYNRATLLRRVQTDLLEGCLRAVPAADDQGDTSIRIVSCHSKLRELQVLKDHLLCLLHQNPDLELRDIIVMAPDIQEYAPLVPAVFEEIQHSIADRSVRRRNNIIGVFLSFLNLFNGRFGWSELLDLLCRPSVHPQFRLSATDLDTLRQWVVGAGIRWGLSGEQRGEAGLAAFDTNSWRAGLDRMLMGCAIDSSEFVDGVLPYSEPEGRGALPLGGLCHYIDLIDKAYHEFRLPHPFADWAERFLFYATALFGDDYDTEVMELRTMLTEAAELIAPFHGSPVDFAVMYDWLNTTAGEHRSSSGFLRGQLTFCSMLPMRSIPFQVVCLLGLNDGIFPRSDSRDTFDLAKHAVRPGDRSPRADDRYQFLEALLAARSYLYLSYIGQSIRTNERIPPSVVVTEFIETLELGYGVEDIVVHHPLHPFSRWYFSGGGSNRLFSHDGYYCKTAERLQLQQERQEPWWQGEVGGSERSILFGDLLRFYRSPQRYFVRDRLGIRLEIGVDLPEDRELFELSGLAEYSVEQELVEAAMTGAVTDCFDKIRTEGRWPLGNSGAVAFAEQRKQVERFVDKARGLAMGEKRDDLPVDFVVGGFRITGTLCNVYDNGLLLLRYGRMRGRDLLGCWLHNLVACQVLGTVTTVLLAEDGVVAFRGKAGGPDLGEMLAVYDEGCRSPLPFFVEPAYQYAIQEAKGRVKVTPLDKAIGCFKHRYDNGYEPEWELLFRSDGEGVVKTGEFERFCQEIMCPILGAAGEASV